MHLIVIPGIELSLAKEARFACSGHRKRIDESRSHGVVVTDQISEHAKQLRLIERLEIVDEHLSVMI